MERNDLIRELTEIAEDRHGAKNTHLLSWLEKGCFHCQHGSEEWCQGDYLDSARAYIERLEAVAKGSLATIASLSEALAEAEKKGAEVEVIVLPWQYATVGYPAKAKSLFGTYSIFQDEDGYTFILDLKDISRGHASVPEAKAAAQADFAARVRSLLAPPRDLSQGVQHGCA